MIELTMCDDGFLAEIDTDEDFESFLKIFFEHEEDLADEDEGDDIGACMRESLGGNWW